MVTAALGGDIEVPTIDGGKTKVKSRRAPSPAGASGCKARACRFCARGRPATCTFRPMVETPQNLTKKQRELLAEFDRLSSTETQPESSGFFGKVKEFLDGLGGRAGVDLSLTARMALSPQLF